MKIAFRIKKNLKTKKNDTKYFTNIFKVGKKVSYEVIFSSEMAILFREPL